MAKSCLLGWGPCTLAMVVLSGTGALAQPVKPSAPPPAKELVADGPPRQIQPSGQTRHSADRAPPDSGRPFIGPRTTQGLAEDAIARSSGR